MVYTEVILYLQVLDFFTTLIRFKMGLKEASPFIGVWSISDRSPLS